MQCFQNAAAHLEPGGCFVIEVGVPQLQRLPPGETVRPFSRDPEAARFDEYDIANQGLISYHYWLGDSALGQFSQAVSLRLAGRARPDGAARRHDVARALERLVPRAVHQ